MTSLSNKVISAIAHSPKMTPIPRKGRIENDFYETPVVLTEGLLDYLCLPPGTTVLEPCAGNGSVVRPMRDRALDVLATDLMGTGDDAATAEYWERIIQAGKPAWIITNPPYGNQLPDQILPLAWDNCTEGMAMLLRITYAEPCASRGDWLECMSDYQVAQMSVWPRPRFRPDTNKTDSCTVCWFVWKKNFSWTGQGMQSPFMQLRYKR